MMLRMHFATLRWIILALAVLAQIYFFVHARRAIGSSRRSARFKSQASRLVGAAIGLLFVMNYYIMVRPIPWVDAPVTAQVGLFDPPAVWGLGSIFSALILCLTRVAVGLGRTGVRVYRGLAGRRAPDPVNVGRRRFLRAGVSGLAAAPFVLSGYGAAYASKAYEVQELTLPFGRLMRVVQLTDIHAGIYMNREEIRRYADQVIALQPDVFVLTGDYISNSMVFLPGCLEEMARVRARHGTFATLGNHEHWYGELSELQAIFREYRIPLLNNSHQVIQTERGPFAVAGIDDLRTGNPDLEAALRGLDATIPTLLLSHRPEIFPQAAAYGIPLTLAGHYHGGQIKLSLPGGDISLAHLSTPYPEGLYRINASHLYVSRGVGTTFTPVRLNARPEVTLFRLI
ncbi:MAG TPA: metallophosphoesterase [Syntrophobacteria bacterium]|nr:metallophosphoesterase [Syntrophobacteria bacterium]